MAISVYLGKVNKRKNSTFVPSLTTGAVQVVLKDGTSDNRPSFLLSSTTPPDANYLRWGDRYFYVDDIIYERNNLYTLNCVLDVLATYKSNILSTSAFVAYDTTTNTELTDSRLSIETTKTMQSDGERFTAIGSAFFIAVSVTGRSCTATYALTISDAMSLLSNMTNWLDNSDVLPYPDIGTLTDVVEAIETFCYNLVAIGRQLVATGKADDGIRSACIVPLPITHVSGTTEELYLGNYRTGISAKRINPSNVYVDGVNLTIPWQADDWRRNAPYHQLYMYIPYVGTVNLSPSELIDNDNIGVTAYLSPMNGDCIMIVSSSGRELYQFNTNLSTPFAIGSSNVTPFQATTAVASAVAGAIGAIATGGASAIVSGTAGIIGVTNNLSGTPSTIGSGAGGAIFGLGSTAFPPIVKIFSVFHDTNVAPSSVASAIGTPAMEVKTLSSLSGYVECRNASVSASAESQVLEEINSYLNSGIFIE